MRSTSVRVLGAALLGLSLGCGSIEQDTSRETPEPAAEPAPEPELEPEPEPAPPEPTIEPVRVPVVDEPVAESQAGRAKRWSAPALTPVLVHDGPVYLRAQAGRAAVIIDAWPRTLEPTSVAAPGPEPTPIDRSKTFHLHPGAHVETDSGEAFMTVRVAHPRSGQGVTHSYRRDAQGWTRLELPERPPLIGYYGALLGREGAVLGLTSYRPDTRQEIDREEVAAVLDSLRPSFVQLAGPPGVAIPELPADRKLHDFEVGEDGTIHALARPEHPDHPKARSSPRVEVWSWAPGETKPSAIALPDTEPDTRLSLSVTGTRVLVYGDRRYLVEAGPTAKRIIVELPEDDDEYADAGEEIGAALRTPSGELWITLNSDVWGQRLLLARSNDGVWHQVEAPALSERLVPMRPWLFEVGWEHAELESDYRFPMYEQLAWVHGRVWVLGSFGPFITSSGAWHMLRRAALYAVGDPIPQGPPEVVEPVYADWAKGASSAEQASLSPGGRGCDVFWVELDPRGRANALSSAKLDALAELNGSDELGYALAGVFVAELDGRRSLVLEVRQPGEAEAQRVLAALARTVKRSKLEASCRAPQPIEAVRMFME